jgi:hypothetical protein
MLGAISVIEAFSNAATVEWTSLLEKVSNTAAPDHDETIEVISLN